MTTLRPHPTLLRQAVPSLPTNLRGRLNAFGGNMKNQLKDQFNSLGGQVKDQLKGAVSTESIGNMATSLIPLATSSLVGGIDKANKDITARESGYVNSELSGMSSAQSDKDKLQMGTVGAIAVANPLAGAVAAGGMALGKAVAGEDEYGVARSDGAAIASDMINPISAVTNITSGLSQIGEGNIKDGLISMVPGVGAWYNNSKNRDERRRLQRIEKATKLSNTLRQNFNNNVGHLNNKYDASGKEIPMAKKGMKFSVRKGHKTALGKSNIIPDGATHGQNSGLKKGDKGIAVVLNGEKKLEIEKEEWTTSAKTSRLIDKGLASKDVDKHEKLGKVLRTELLNNTHDYTGKFKVNRYKSTEDAPKANVAPRDGDFAIHTSDIKPIGGQYQVLGKGGEVVSNIGGSFRVFSRPHTKRLVALAKEATNKAGRKKLGKYMEKVVDIQTAQGEAHV